MNGINDQTCASPQPQGAVISTSLSSTPDPAQASSVNASPTTWVQPQTPQSSAPATAVIPSTNSSPAAISPLNNGATAPVVVSSNSFAQLNGVVSLPDSATAPVSGTNSGVPLVVPSNSTTSPFPTPPKKPKTIFNAKSLIDLVRETDPNLQLDEEAEESLTILSEEFVEKVANASIRMAKHRGSATVEGRDVKHVFDRDWSIYVPGISSPEKYHKRTFILNAHRQRQLLIKNKIKRN